MIILLVLLACALCGLVITLIIVHVVRPAAPQPSPSAARTTDKTDEKYSFVDSHYQGIRSKLVSRTSAKEKASLEYPLTGNRTIDTTVASAIDQLDHEFRQSVAAGRTFHRPMTEAISYQITHNTNTALSVIVQANQDTHGAHPASFTRFWTFNKQTGAAITLRDLVGGNTAYLRTVIDAAQRSVAATIAERQQPAVDLGEIVTEDALTNFTITNYIANYPGAADCDHPCPAKTTAKTNYYPCASRTSTFWIVRSSLHRPHLRRWARAIYQRAT